MTSHSPTVIVIGGPNGAGKSTIAPGLLTHLGIETFVNADTIARGLSAMRPDSRAFEAGRIMLREVHALGDERASFAFETTLASRTFAPWIRRLAHGGYRFVLVYVWVRNADISVERVAARVKAGGHDVPAEVVRRRWSRSVDNFWNLYLPLADRWFVYDNSVTGRSVHIARGHRDQTPQIVDPARWEDFSKSRHDPETA